MRSGGDGWFLAWQAVFASLVIALAGCGGGGGGGVVGGIGPGDDDDGGVGGTGLAYDLVYVRAPRYGDETNTVWPEVTQPARADPGADLVLLRRDGSEEVLLKGGNGSVTDPFVSFDAESVYFSYFHDLRPGELNERRQDLSLGGADIYRIQLDTREVEQLTFGEFTPNTGAGNWDESNPVDPPSRFNRLGYGIVNLAPCPLPGGQIAFTSNRNGFIPPHTITAPTLQLFVMDEDGANVTPIAPMTISSALHPTILRDGRLMFSTYESQGLRSRRLWGLWSIYPDGREWQPLISAFKPFSSFHFMTQLSGEDLVAEYYYNANNNGFGSLLRFPIEPPQGTPAFYSAFPDQNPEIGRTNQSGEYYPFQMGFTPWGMDSITPLTHGGDKSAPPGMGKFTHPSAAPDQDLLVVWTPGPANNLERPTNLPRYDGGLYLMRGGEAVWDPTELILIKNDPEYNEAWPRAVVPYRDVHGVDEPARIPWLPNDGAEYPALPAGTPFGLIGTSSFYKRESFPGTGADNYDGLDKFNTAEHDHSSNWEWQGADAGKYDDSDIWAVRIVALEPNTHRSYGPNYGQHFVNHAGERHRILGEIPLRKFDLRGAPILDPEGNPDTSFLAKVPADTPFTFQTLDRNGMVLNMAQTWHQVRPGEMRVNCGGCHAHSQEPLSFEGTAASMTGFEIFDLAKVTPLLTRTADPDPGLRVEQESLVNVEFYRDIRPILQRSCVPCHTKDDPDPPGQLVLDDTDLYSKLPGDYLRLAADEKARWGYPSVLKDGRWRLHNASRYVRKFQSRRSLLVWKIFGERLDGWSNEDHPTESIPGDPGTLPPGANPRDADLDFTGSVMPPRGSWVPALTEDEKMTVARWIDLGAPINSGEATGDGAFGWFLDDLKPTLAVSLPRARANLEPVDSIRFGLADANSGIDPATLSVTATFAVQGRDPGVQLADLAMEVDDGVFVIALDSALPAMAAAEVSVEVADRQGNITRVCRSFSTVR